MTTPDPNSPAIETNGVRKTYGGLTAVADATLRVEHGEMTALLGPSGSGKTTLLRLIAGFERPDAGSVHVGGELVAGEREWLEPEERRIGMVFQHGALFPHLSVSGNVGFGTKEERRVAESLGLVGLGHRANAYPHELSGGERQRIALARALAADPEVVLLDEPFAALDTGLRETLRDEVKAILREAGTSALLVTHDQAEALSLADRVAVMCDGRIEQTGSPQEIYDRPATRWIAEFLGDADVLPGTAADGVVECELGRFPIRASLLGPVDVVVRPESIAIGSHAPAGAAEVRARIVDRSFYGHDQLVKLELASGVHVRSRRLGFAVWNRDDHVRVWVEGPVTALPAETQRPTGAAR